MSWLTFAGTHVFHDDHFAWLRGAFGNGYERAGTHFFQFCFIQHSDIQCGI